MPGTTSYILARVGTCFHMLGMLACINKIEAGKAGGLAGEWIK